LSAGSSARKADDEFVPAPRARFPFEDHSAIQHLKCASIEIRPQIEPG
jgi:hypothetical protein